MSAFAFDLHTDLLCIHMLQIERIETLNLGKTSRMVMLVIVELKFSLQHTKLYTVVNN